MKTKKQIHDLTVKPELARAIRALVAEAGQSNNSDLYCQMVASVLKLQNDQASRGDVKILNTSLRELRWALKVFKPYRQVKKVSVFGSARIEQEDPVYKSAKQFGRLMAENGWMVITGASTGVMRAGNEGAGRSFSFGVNIKLPFEQAVNPVVRDDQKLIHFKYFFTRKLIFVKESNAICLFPGGFGTLDEGFEVLTLVQTGKTLPRPIVMVENKNGKYWSAWMRFVKQGILAKRMIDTSDLSLFEIVKTPEEARDRIVNFYRNYHSQRYVEDFLVIRMQRSLPVSVLRKLNKNFSDIIVKGKIKASGPLTHEFDEPDIVHLPRLVFNFSRKHFGRLRQMINEINLY